MASDNQEVDREPVKGSLSRGSFQMAEALKQAFRPVSQSTAGVGNEGAWENIDLRGALSAERENQVTEEGVQKWLRRELHS